MSHARAFDITTPTDNNFAGDGDDKIVENQVDLKQRLELDHNMDGILNTALPTADGYHKKVTMKQSASDPAIVSATVGTCTISNANPAVVALTAHGKVTGDRISFTTTGSLLDPLVSGTYYFVIKTTNDAMNIATSYANAIVGTKIATTTAGSGVHTMIGYSKGYGVVYTKDVDGITELFFIEADTGFANQLTENGVINLNTLQNNIDGNGKDITGLDNVTATTIQGSYKSSDGSLGVDSIVYVSPANPDAIGPGILRRTMITIKKGIIVGTQKQYTSDNLNWFNY